MLLIILIAIFIFGTSMIGHVSRKTEHYILTLFCWFNTVMIRFDDFSQKSFEEIDILITVSWIFFIVGSFNLFLALSIPCWSNKKVLELKNKKALGEEF